MLRTDVIGRNAIDGRWSFQIVEEFDDLYHDCVTQRIREVEAALLDGRRHVYEAEMKERRRTEGHPGHESPTSRRVDRGRRHPRGRRRPGPRGRHAHPALNADQAPPERRLICCFLERTTRFELATLTLAR